MPVSPALRCSFLQKRSAALFDAPDAGHSGANTGAGQKLARTPTQNWCKKRALSFGALKPARSRCSRTQNAPRPEISQAQTGAAAAEQSGDKNADSGIKD